MYTSIQKRIKTAVQGKQPTNLLAFVGSEHKNKTKGLTFNFSDYLALIEATGCCIRADKCRYIDENQTVMLSSLNISAKSWLILTTKFTKHFHGAVGHADVLSDFCQHQAINRRTTLSACKQLLA